MKESESKKKRDTGGGCCVCGSNPAVNIEGTYWLCGPCVNEYYKPKNYYDRSGRGKKI